MNLTGAVDLSLLGGAFSAAAFAWNLRGRLRASDERVQDAVERRYNILEAIPDGVYIIDEHESFTHINEEAERLIRHDGEYVGRPLETVLDPLASDLIPEIRRARDAGEATSRTAYFPATERWVEVRIKPAASETVVYLRDMTLAKDAQARLESSESRLRMLMGQVPAVLWSVDRLGRFTSISGAGMAALAVDEQAMLGRSCAPFIGAKEHAMPLASVFAGNPLAIEWPRNDLWLRHHIEPLRATNGQTIGAVGVSLDITEVRNTQARLEAAALSDTLTGLPNRLAIEEMLKATLIGGEQMRTDTISAILFVDLDRFKSINDTFGHHVGDELLRIVGTRLRSAVDSADVVARQGGDEFIVLLRSVHGAEDVGRIATRLLNRCSEPATINGQEMYVSASIGAALWPDDGHTAEDLIKHADIAMYVAKLRRATFVFYQSDMHSGERERMALANDLRGAWDRGEMRLVYQPMISVQDGSIVGCEALLRWHRPPHGNIEPSAFIAIAEETGAIVEITRWVLRTACEFAAKVRAAMPAFRIAVNFSARDLKEDGVHLRIAEALFEADLPPEALEIEITEGVLLDESAIASLIEIRALGVQITVDDFGTAYNSLSYLKQLPVTALKIDRSFVHDVVHNHYDQAIVKAIATLAATLGIRVVAEGVESDAQFAFVSHVGCNEAQGFRFSRPLESTAFEALMRSAHVYNVSKSAPVRATASRRRHLLNARVTRPMLARRAIHRRAAS